MKFSLKAFVPLSFVFFTPLCATDLKEAAELPAPGGFTTPLQEIPLSRLQALEKKRFVLLAERIALEARFEDFQSEQFFTGTRDLTEEEFASLTRYNELTVTFRENGLELTRVEEALTILKTEYCSDLETTEEFASRCPSEELSDFEGSSLHDYSSGPFASEESDSEN